MRKQTKLLRNRGASLSADRAGRARVEQAVQPTQTGSARLLAQGSANPASLRVLPASEKHNMIRSLGRTRFATKVGISRWLRFSVTALDQRLCKRCLAHGYLQLTIRSAKYGDFIQLVHSSVPPAAFHNSPATAPIAVPILPTSSPLHLLCQHILSNLNLFYPPNHTAPPSLF